MSSDNDRCFQCQEIGHMACYCPHIQCYDCDNYGHVAMDCLDKIPPSGKPAHWHATEVPPITGMIDPPLDIIATPDILTMITKIDPGSVIPDPAHIQTGIEVAAITTSIGVTPGHSTDLPNVVSHATEAQVPTAIVVTHHTTDLHPIGLFPEMTADLNTNPENTTTKPAQGSPSTSQATPWKNKDKRQKQVTIDDPPSEYYSSDDHDSGSEVDLN